MQNISIFVSGLRKSYQNKEVLKNVNFSVLGGTIYALLGSNGAGKTTIVKILATLLKPDGVMPPSMSSMSYPKKNVYESVLV